MTLWIKIAIVAAILSGTFATGIYVKAKFAEAAQAEALREQIKTANERAEELHDKAAAIETQLQADRQTLATLNRKWTALRAQKDRNVCLLDSGTISLLQSATGDTNPDAR